MQTADVEATIEFRALEITTDVFRVPGPGAPFACFWCGGSRLDIGAGIAGLPPPLDACSGCQWARYCRPECQRLHWAGGHETECQLVREFAAQCTTMAAGRPMPADLVDRYRPGWKLSTVGDRLYYGPSVAICQPDKPLRRYGWPRVLSACDPIFSLYNTNLGPHGNHPWIWSQGQWQL